MTTKEKEDDTTSEKSWVLEEFDEYDDVSWHFIHPDVDPDGTSADDADKSSAHDSAVKGVDSEGSSLDIEILESVYDESSKTNMCTPRIPNVVVMRISEEVGESPSVSDRSSRGSRHGDTASSEISNTTTEGSFFRDGAAFDGNEDTLSAQDAKWAEKEAREKRRLKRRLRKEGENKENEKASSMEDKGKKAKKSDDNMGKCSRIGPTGKEGGSEGNKCEPLVEAPTCISSQVLTVLWTSQWIIDAAYGAFHHGKARQPYTSSPPQMPRRNLRQRMHQAPGPNFAHNPGAPNPRFQQRSRGAHTRNQRNRQ